MCGVGFLEGENMIFVKIALIFLVSPVFAADDEATEINVSCWHSTIDSDGSFLCEYVTITAKSDGKMVVPELAAIASNEKKTREQADRACRALGFAYAIRFELENPEREVLQLRLRDFLAAGDLVFSRDPFIQHLNCEG